MLFVYLVSLIGSSAAFGAYAYRLLAAQGYALDYETNLLILAGGATLFAAAQALYAAFVYAVSPPHGRAFLAVDALSHLAAVILLPYLLHMTVSWPHAALDRLEPLLYLAAFGTVHALLKLLSFFTALQSAPGSRRKALPWGAFGSLLAGAAVLLLTIWVYAVEERRPRPAEETSFINADGAWAEARTVPEGAAFSWSIDEASGDDLSATFLWSPGDEGGYEGRVYITAVLEGSRTQRIQETLSLDSRGWTAFTLSSQEMPEDFRRGMIFWMSERQPTWRRVASLRPMVQSGEELLMSGPYMHHAEPKPERPSVVLVAVDGLAARYTGGDDSLTPNLDRFAGGCLRFENCFAPSPEAVPSLMTMLTGIHPLHHGYLADRMGPLPDPFTPMAALFQERGFMTAAFTEGERHVDLTFGSGFERGFDIYDDGYAPPTNASIGPNADGPADQTLMPTLRRAEDWAMQQAEAPFFLFVRISGLTGLPNPSNGETTDEDIYRQQLAALDAQLSTFIASVQQAVGGSSICIGLAASCGVFFDESGMREQALKEPNLWVPFMIDGPGLEPGLRQELCGLEDLFPTLASAAGVEHSELVEGTDLTTKTPPVRGPIAVGDLPLRLSVRTPFWRASWSSGVEPFTGDRLTSAGDAELFHAVRSRRRGSWEDDRARYNPEIAARLRGRMEQVLLSHIEFWNGGNRPLLPVMRPIDTE